MVFRLTKIFLDLTAATDFTYQTRVTAPQTKMCVYINFYTHDEIKIEIVSTFSRR